MGMDKFDSQNQSVEVYACLQKGRQPKVMNNSLTCDESSMIRIASDELPHTALMLVPYPEPGMWYLGLQVRCLHPDTRLKLPCWGNFRFSNLTTSINIHIQPCGYRPQGEICGPYGVCVRTHKGVYMFTSCRYSSGYKGWTCDDPVSTEPAWKLISDTPLLTLSNLFFLYAMGLALYYRLYTESLIYGATMFFSTFYHTCDQEMNHKHLPISLEKACHALYVSKEVLHHPNRPRRTVCPALQLSFHLHPVWQFSTHAPLPALLIPPKFRPVWQNPTHHPEPAPGEGRQSGQY